MFTRALWVALLAAALPVRAAERVWTDTAGRTLRAEFVRELDGEITLLVHGKLVTWPLDKLSPEDQQFVRDLAGGAASDPAASSPAFGAPASADAQPAEPAASASTSDAQPGSPKSLSRKPLPIVLRVWTDRFGNQTTAKFVRVTGDNVVLAVGRKTVIVPFYDLTDDDQEHIRALLTSRGQESLLPPRPPVALAPAPPAAAPLAADPPPAEAPFGAPGVGPGLAPAAPALPGAGSAVFEEMRAKAEESRREMMARLEQQREAVEAQVAEAQAKMGEMRDQLQAGQFAALPALPAVTPPPPSDAAPLAAAPPIPQAAPAAPAAAAPHVSPEMAAQIRKSLIIAAVVVGVIGTVGMVVFVAIVIAAAGSVSRQRRYS